MKTLLTCILLLSSIAFLRATAQQDSLPGESDTLVSKTLKGKNIDSLMATFKYQSGHMLISNVAALDVPEGFKFLGATDAQAVLTDLWNNPPDDGILGMLIPDSNNISQATWAITFSYDEDGYVSDVDAEKINYTELLEQMKEATKEANAERIKAGYSKMDLIGWAQTPYYDMASHKLHWAKELMFDNDSLFHTLNYNIRMLGRKGVLVMNVIAGMESLGDVKAHMNKILASTNFNQGSRYEDFDDKTDKVAAYGIGALVAGTLLAKTGLLAKLGLMLAAGWKFIAAGVIAFIGYFRKKFFSGKNEG